jgi:hypothetical protein
MLVDPFQCLAIELENLFRPNRPVHTIGQTRLVGNSHTNKARQDNTVSINQNLWLAHLFFSKG